MLSQSLPKLILRGLLGFLFGLALWQGGISPYAAIAAAIDEPLIRLTEKPAVTRLQAQNHEVVIHRADFHRNSGRPGIPFRDLTFNIVLLTTLFALGPDTFSDRNVGRFCLAATALFVTHLVALFVAIKAIYALKLGNWSTVNYGPFARNFWGTAEHFYRLVGLYALAFAAWWILKPQPRPLEDRPADNRPKRRSARRR